MLRLARQIGLGRPPRRVVLAERAVERETPETVRFRLGAPKQEHQHGCRFGLRPPANAQSTLTTGGASWQLSSGPVSKRLRVSEAEVPAEDGDVASELCNRPVGVVVAAGIARVLCHDLDRQGQPSRAIPSPDPSALTRAASAGRRRQRCIGSAPFPQAFSCSPLSAISAPTNRGPCDRVRVLAEARADERLATDPIASLSAWPTRSRPAGAASVARPTVRLGAMRRRSSATACRRWARQTPRARSFSSSEWGRHPERAARRPRALSNRQFLSRYSRFDDGHPSPSPNREWMKLGTKGDSLIIKNPPRTAGPDQLRPHRDGRRPTRARPGQRSFRATRVLWSEPEHRPTLRRTLTIGGGCRVARLVPVDGTGGGEAEDLGDVISVG